MTLFRTTKKYDFRTDFMPGGGKFRHLDRIIDPNVVQAREPRMDEDGTSVVFLPYPDFDSGVDLARQPQVVPDLLDPDDERSYGGWLLVAPGVRYMGKNPVTLLFDNPDDSGFIPSEHHPVHLVYETAMRAVKSKANVETPFGTSYSDNWKILLDGDKGGQKETYGCLPKPGLMALAYALVFQCGKADLPSATPVGSSSGEKPVVFVMSQNVAQTLFSKLDPHAQTGITGALGVHFFDRKKGSCRAMTAGSGQVGGVQLGGVRRAPVGAAPTTGQLAGYDVYVSPGNMFGAPLNPAQYAQFACQTLPPWERALRTYTPEKCAEILANQSGLPLSLLYAAWKSQPQYITDEMKTKMRNPVSQNFPAPQPPQSREIENPTYPPHRAAGAFTPPFPGDPFAGTPDVEPTPPEAYAPPAQYPQVFPGPGRATPPAPAQLGFNFGAGGPPGNPAPTADPFDGEDQGIDPVKQAEAEAAFRARFGAQLNQGAAVNRAAAANRQPPRQ